MSLSATSPPWNQTQERLLRQWEEQCRIRAALHHRTAAWYERGHYILGPLAVITTSVSALTQFTQLGATSCTSGISGTDIAILVMTMLGVVLAGLQTFFRFNQSSAQHQIAATKYEGLQHDIEETLSFRFQDRPDPAIFINNTKTALNALAAMNLNVPSYLITQYVKDIDALVRALISGGANIALHVDSYSENSPNNRELVLPSIHIEPPPPVQQESASVEQHKDKCVEMVRTQMAETQPKKLPSTLT